MQGITIYDIFLYARLLTPKSLEKKKPIRDAKMMLMMIAAENHLLKEVNDNTVI